MACLTCRKRKIRCSGDRPTCTNCASYGTTCEYPPPRPCDVPKQDPFSPSKAEAWMQYVTRQQHSSGSSGVAPAAVSSRQHGPSITVPFPTTDIGHIHLSNAFASQLVIDAARVSTRLDDGTTGWTSSASSFGEPNQLHSAIDTAAFLSALDSSYWRNTAGALSIDQAGVHLYGLNASDPPAPPPTHVSPRLARIHPLVPLLPLELADIILNSAAKLTLVDPGLVMTSIQASSSFCARAFAGLALISLANVSEPTFDGDSRGLSLDLEFATAQQLATASYRNSTERVVFDFDGAGVPWTDDRAITVAGFVYLAIRSVFVNGWGEDASTLLSRAVNVLLMLPAASTVRLWFSRVIFLWDLGLNLACSPVGQLSTKRATAGLLEADVLSIHQKLQLYHRSGFAHPVYAESNDAYMHTSALFAAHIPFTANDPDACVFDSLVTLALDLQADLDPTSHELERLIRIQLWLDELPFLLRRDTLTLLVLPVGWQQPPPIATYPPLHTPSYVAPSLQTTLELSAASDEAATQSRNALARIIRVLYFVLTLSCYSRAREAIWLDLMAANLGSKLYLRTYRGEPSSSALVSDQDPLSPDSSHTASAPLPGASVRETSLRAAMMNVGDAADYLVHHRLFWLWPFAEQIIWFAQRVGLCVFDCGLRGWYRGLDEIVSPAGTPQASSPVNLFGSASMSRMDDRLTSHSCPEEPNVQAVIRTTSQMAPDGPHQTILRTIQAVLVRAVTAINHTPSAIGHRTSVRVLSSVAAAASARAPELSGEGVDGTQVPEVRQEGQGVPGILGPSVFVKGARRDIAGGAAMGRARAGRK